MFCLCCFPAPLSFSAVNSVSVLSIPASLTHLAFGRPMPMSGFRLVQRVFLYDTCRCVQRWSGCRASCGFRSFSLVLVQVLHRRNVTTALLQFVNLLLQQIVFTFVCGGVCACLHVCMKGCRCLHKFKKWGREKKNYEICRTIYIFLK